MGGEVSNQEAEKKVRFMIGDLTIQIAILQTQVEQLMAENEALKKPEQKK